MRVKITTALLLVLALTLTGGAATEQPDPAVQATRVKAAFILNFLKYTGWPKPKAGDDNAPLVLVVVGRNGMENTLQTTLQNRTVAGRSIQIRQVKDAAALAAEPSPGDALFVDESCHAEWNAIRETLARRPILTIAEMPGFCSQGGMLNLYEQERRMRFEANPDAAKACGVQLSAELLKLATLVKQERNQ